MKSSNEFLSLIKHEFKWRSRKTKRNSKIWLIVIFAMYIVFTLVMSALSSMHSVVTLDNRLWNGLPFYAMMITIFIGYTMGKAEWRNGTLGWWLSLPFSRMRLLTAKGLGGLLRILPILALFYFYNALLSLNALLVSGSFLWAKWLPYLLYGLEKYVIAICYCPIALALGLLLAIVAETKNMAVKRTLGLSFVSLSFLFQALTKLYFNGVRELLNTDAILIPLTWILCYVMLRASANLLQRKLPL